MRSNVILFALSFAFVAVLLTACGGGNPRPAPSASQASAPAAKSAVPKAATATAAPKGDGTLRIKLNVLNPEKQQDKYAVFFTTTGTVEKGKALGNSAFVGPFVMDTAAELVVDIEKDLKNFLYQHSALTGPMYVDLVVTRLEDTHIRNPLCTPVKLAFEDLNRSNLGNEITVDITDSALNDLYPEEVFIVKIASPQIQGGGGYPTISYERAGSSVKSGMQRGSAGPDFLVAFPVAELKRAGVREATLIVMDEHNKPKSEPMPLTFDENGRCEQGPLVIIKTNR